MPSPRSIRGSIAVTTLVVAALSSALPAHGRSLLETRRAEMRQIDRTIEAIRKDRALVVMRARWTINGSTRRLESMHGRGAAANPARSRHVRRALLDQRREAQHRIGRSGKRLQRRVGALRSRRASIGAWIDTWGIFERCPIRGWHSIADNFGATVRLPGVPVHRHMGNDIAAYSGTPIVAPFDGYASASSSELGGLEVRVEGARGYVYNAHLSSYGTLGSVRAGTVIGYVGATGDATAPHDHLEWHPYDGAAVDPYPYLVISCG